MATTKMSNQELVLKTLSKSAKPMTAYELLGKLKPYGITGPPTVYRALESLQVAGQVHRIESLNAFVACHQHGHEPHPSFFIVCKECGDMEEIHDIRMTHLLKEWSERSKFFVTQQIIELIGLCFRCKQKAK